MHLSFILVSLNTASIELVRQQLGDKLIAVAQSYEEALAHMSEATFPRSTVLLVELGIPMRAGASLSDALSLLLSHTAAYHGLRAVVVGSSILRHNSTAQAIKELEDGDSPRRWYTSRWTMSCIPQQSTEVYFASLELCEGREGASYPAAFDWLRVIRSYLKTQPHLHQLSETSS
jgi:hypothetical protein